jgi:hypothetical protein
VYLSVPMDQQEPQACQAIPTFLLPKHSVTVLLDGATITGNRVFSSHSSGGGLFLGPGGALTLANTLCADNVATQFGGGVALGTGFLAQGSCGITTANVSLLHNTAERGGSQLYVACSSDVHVRGSVLDMGDGSQVVVALAGNVTFDAGVALSCPPGTNFVDSYAGLYDRGA